MLKEANKNTFPWIDKTLLKITLLGGGEEIKEPNEMYEIKIIYYNYYKNRF